MKGKWLSKRIALVGVLLAIGVISGGVVAALNSGVIAKIIPPVVHKAGELKIVGNLNNNSVSIVAPDGKVYTARIHSHSIITKETGKIRKNGENITISIGDRTGVIKVIGFNLSLTEEQKQKAIEMALNNEKVKELIENKNYTILKVGPWVRIGAVGSETRLENEQEAKVIGASIWLKVEDRCYYVGVNFESGKVDVQEIPCL